MKADEKQLPRMRLKRRSNKTGWCLYTDDLDSREVVDKKVYARKIGKALEAAALIEFIDDIGAKVVPRRKGE